MERTTGSRVMPEKLQKGDGVGRIKTGLEKGIPYRDQHVKLRVWHAHAVFKMDIVGSEDIGGRMQEESVSRAILWSELSGSQRLPTA